MARFETERTIADREQAFLAALAGGRTALAGLTVQNLDRHAGEWADLVPTDPELRAAVLGRVVAKYGLPARARNLRAALGTADPAVAAAYERQSGRPLSAAGDGQMPMRERLRWWRTAASRRLEGLPPFWLAYALTLTETVGGGVLALPIAFARFGPVGATVVLGIFGVINALTVAALVESITRNGNMRYGPAFFGRLVGDYLGRPGNLVAMPALFLLDAVGFLVALVGFGTTIGSVTGLPAVIWAGLLFGVVVIVLWRDSLDATVAVAVAVGIADLVLIGAITILAAGYPNTAAESAPGSTGLALDVSLLEVVFGVALVAFFGHTSAGHAAKVVLARDPGGRQLMAGNVAAILSAMVIYIAFVLAVTAAVGPEALSGYQGTALTLLAERVGPVVDALGTAFVVLGLGLSALYVGLGLFNQMAEAIAALPGAAWRRRRRLTRFAVQALPLGVMFLVVEGLLNADAISFTAPLSIVGTITLPLLGGVLPMLLVVAARRRGERLPSRVIGPLGMPLTALVIGTLYLLAVVAFGVWIWREPLGRLAAIGVAIATVALALVSWRRGAFAPRTVVEYRVESGPPTYGIVSVMSAGRPLSAEIALHETTDVRIVMAPEAMVGAPSRLRSVIVALPEHAARELELWIHSISNDGASVSMASDVDIITGADSRRLTISGGSGPLATPIGRDAIVVKIVLPTGSTNQ